MTSKSARVLAAWRDLRDAEAMAEYSNALAHGLVVEQAALKIRDDARAAWIAVLTSKDEPAAFSFTVPVDFGALEKALFDIMDRGRSEAPDGSA